MILIADSGSTKTDWCVVEHGQLIQQISTKGTNPFFQSEEEISNEIATALIPQLKTNKFEAVHFYGAGCAFPDKIETMRKAIASHLQVSGEIEVSTDMLAAARSLCGHQPGIACIMGTGSNSCYYDGKNIVTNVSPLGFILGDEVIRELVLNSFKKFLKRNVMQYDYRHAPVHFIGSVAFYYRELLSEACKIMGVHLGTIIQSPMEGLIKFHE